MIGVPGTADRLFGALRDAGVSVMLISQGSSEHSICFAVREEAAEQVRTVVERAFAVELSEGQVQRVGVTKSCAIIAVVRYNDLSGNLRFKTSDRAYASSGAGGVIIRDSDDQGSSESAALCSSSVSHPRPISPLAAALSALAMVGRRRS